MGMIQLMFRKEKPTFMIELSDSNLKFGFRFTNGEKMASKALSTELFHFSLSSLAGWEVRREALCQAHSCTLGCWEMS